MKKLLFHFLLFVDLCNDIFAAKEPEFVYALEYIGLCEGVKTRNDFISFEHFQLWPNRSTTGYIDILQDFPLTTTLQMKFQAFFQQNDTWSSSSLSFDKLNFCRHLEKDVWFVPIVRFILNIPERCPMKKSHLIFKSTMLFKRTRGILPIGCAKGTLTLMGNDETLACVDVVTRTSQYSQRHKHSCIAA